MATHFTSDADKPLEQLLEELTDARLEKRVADIAKLQDEICKRQARGERASASRLNCDPPQEP